MDRSVPSLGQGAAWSRRVAKGCAILLGLFVAYHLWTIAAAAQDRESYEALMGVEPVRTPYRAIGFFVVVIVCVVSLRWARYGVGGWFGGTLDPARRSFWTVVLAFSALFIVGHCATLGAFGEVAPEYDAVAGLMSSTWHGVPVVALLHLLGALSIASSVGFAASRPRCVRRALGSWATAVALLVTVGLFLLGTLAVLRFATGSGAIFLL